MRKIKEISDRLLEEECEKFKLSEDNFILKQILREKRIIFEWMAIHFNYLYNEIVK